MNEKRPSKIFVKMKYNLANRKSGGCFDTTLDILFPPPQLLDVSKGNPSNPSNFEENQMDVYVFFLYWWVSNLAEVTPCVRI